MDTLTTPQVRKKRDEEEATVIDVLPREEYEKKHIPGSLNIPITTPDFPKYVEETVGGTSEPVVVYCANENCPASKQAAEALEAYGFKNVGDYGAGLQAWEESGLPVAPAQ